MKSLGVQLPSLRSPHTIMTSVAGNAPSHTNQNQHHESAPGNLSGYAEDTKKTATKKTFPHYLATKNLRDLSHSRRPD